MNVRLHILNASGVFDVVSKFIEDEFAKSLRRISETLSVSDVDVVLYNNPKGVIPEVGIGGYCPNGHLVFVYLDSRLPTLKRIIQEQLKRTLAHELHHCIGKKWPHFLRGPKENTTQRVIITGSGFSVPVASPVGPVTHSAMSLSVRT